MAVKRQRFNCSGEQVVWLERRILNEVIMLVRLWSIFYLCREQESINIGRLSQTTEGGTDTQIKNDIPQSTDNCCNVDFKLIHF